MDETHDENKIRPGDWVYMKDGGWFKAVPGKEIHSIDIDQHTVDEQIVLNIPSVTYTGQIPNDRRGMMSELHQSIDDYPLLAQFLVDIFAAADTYFDDCAAVDICKKLKEHLGNGMLMELNHMNFYSPEFTSEELHQAYLRLRDQT